MLLTLLLDPYYISDRFVVVLFSLLAVGVLLEVGILVWVVKLKRRGKLSWVEAVLVWAACSILALVLTLKATNSL